MYLLFLLYVRYYSLGIVFVSADTANDLSRTESDVITMNTALLKQYIDDGGSVMSHTGGTDDYVYGEGCIVFFD